MVRPLVIYANQPAINAPLADDAVERLSGEPLAPVFAAFVAVAFAAGGYQVVGNGVAAFVAWLDVIQRVSWYAAVCAGMLPCVEDLLPESLLCGALWDES